MNCQALDVNGHQCRNKGPFCSYHVYMNEYTKEMIQQSTLCSGCRKMKFKQSKICDECKNRVKPTQLIIKCAKDGCTFKKSKENKYCGKHQMFIFVDETTLLGLKCCKQVVRGCRNQLPLDGYNQCDNCLQIERDKDHKRRSELVKNETEKQCSVCCKLQPMNAFNGKLGETKTCMSCREANKRADEKRDMQHVRALANQNALKPERKAVKNIWKEANYEKVSKYWMDARNKLIESNIEGFLKRNAEQAKNWRDANPEKVKQYNINKINSINHQYGVYKTSANSKQLEISLTKGDFMDMVVLPCYYCGIIQPKGFNGINRLNSTQGYVMTNCVSCCEMCNRMKGCLGPTIFINRIEHILTHLSIYSGRLHPEDFNNSMCISYSEYRLTAKKRNIDFHISKEYFYEKTKEPCYLCGKMTSSTHKNGLDRYDNMLEYSEINCRTCCSNCNYLKRDYEYEKIIEKCKLIYQKHIDVQTYQDNQEIRTIVKGNKLNPEEKKEKERVRKQKQRESLRARYGDEEYKRLHAIKIAEQRKKK